MTREPDSSSTMHTYYQARASVYDKVYGYPERQEDLRFLERYIPEQFKDRDLIEVAAGTGYWTQFIAPQVRSVLATDANDVTLNELRGRKLPENVNTEVADAYELETGGRTFNAAFAGCWLSHVPKDRLAGFINNLHRKLTDSAKIILLDNSIAQCERLPVTFTDTEGNTFQDRVLEDGSSHRVLKNFPTEAELRALIPKTAHDIKMVSLTHYWLFEYNL